MNAPSREAAEEEIEKFGDEYGAKYAKAIETLTRGQEHLLTFFDFPAEHLLQQPGRVGVRHCSTAVERVTKGASSRQRGLTIAFKLLEMAQLRWRRLNGAALPPLVRAGVPLNDGVRIEEDDQQIVEMDAEVAA
jgi:hypothetical protein